MRKYELIIIVKPIGKKEFENTIHQIENIITDNGDDIERTERWGKRHIAYEIDGFNEALYAFIAFKAESKTVRKLEKFINDTEKVMQHMIISKEVKS